MLVDVKTMTKTQDPDSGEIKEVWTILPSGIGIYCAFHGILDGGIRVSGTTERFGAIYENIDWAKMNFGPFEKIDKRAQITNVRNLSGTVIWREEEMAGSPPTVFDVQGVIPVVDGLGRHTENVGLLQRHEVQ